MRLLLLLLISLQCFAGSVGEDNNAFALSVFKEIEDRNNNLAFSPYSLFSNIALLYYGAQGDTAKQIKDVLHLSTAKESFLQAFHKHLTGLTHKTRQGYQLYIANGLFPHKGTHFLKAFEEIATKTFDAKLQSVDYAVPDSALETINNWVSQKTQGYITQLVEENDIDQSTRLILANAVYFQGDWVHPFDPKNTSSGNFQPAFGPPVQTPMLMQVHHFPYFENDDIQCLALPFIREETDQPFLECVILLPKIGKIDELENGLDARKLNDWIGSTKPTLIDLQIPKFCISKRLLMNYALKTIGMQDAFTYQADFSKIDGMKDLFLNQVLHETFFSFHENGVTAASASTSHLGLIAKPPTGETPKLFVADHPFLFFIVDYHSRAILFMGRVINPTTGTCDEN
ncbi:MAG: hypothetical protein K1000chlam2_00664 [Chlamydiae bacterium]|nr:hypothetical protein [Chlamydiota bacterium]